MSSEQNAYTRMIEIGEAYIGESPSPEKCAELIELFHRCPNDPDHFDHAAEILRDVYQALDQPRFFDRSVPLAPVRKEIEDVCEKAKDLLESLASISPSTRRYLKEEGYDADGVTGMLVVALMMRAGIDVNSSKLPPVRGLPPAPDDQRSPLPPGLKLLEDNLVSPLPSGLFPRPFELIVRLLSPLFHLKNTMLKGKSKGGRPSPTWTDPAIVSLLKVFKEHYLRVLLEEPNIYLPDDQFHCPPWLDLDSKSQREFHRRWANQYADRSKEFIYIALKLGGKEYADGSLDPKLSGLRHGKNAAIDGSTVSALTAPPTLDEVNRIAESKQ